MVCARCVVARAFGSIVSDEDASGCGDSFGDFPRIFHRDDQVFRAVGVAECDQVVLAVHHDDAAVVQRPGRDVAARQFGQLSFHFADHLFGKTARRRQQNCLRVASVLGLRQQIGSHESGHGARIGHYQHFGRAGRHVDRHGRGADLLFGDGDVLVARAEDLIRFRDAFGAVSHRRDRLRPPRFENTVYAGQRGGIEDRRGDVAVFIGRGAENDFFAAGYARRDRQHQHGRE